LEIWNALFDPFHAHVILTGSWENEIDAQEIYCGIEYGTAFYFR